MWKDLLVAIQFLTRIPMPSMEYDPEGLPRAAKFFPVVGLLVGGGGCLIHWALVGHLPEPVIAIAVLLGMILLTGAFHEDGLADVADGFGGGWNREQVLLILKDSRIGSYGSVAIVLALFARLFLLSSLAPGKFAPYVLSAHVLCRWTTLPLSYFMKSARVDGQGARVADNLSFASVCFGSVCSVAIAIYLLRWTSWVPMLFVSLITFFSAMYYQKRVQGITGDCLGATNQLAEIAVYVCGVWH